MPPVAWAQQAGSAANGKGAARPAAKAASASEAARRIARFLASSHPLDPQLQLRRGLSLVEEGRADEAINVFTRLTIEHPELPEPYNNLAVLYASEGQYDKARQSLESALRTHPSYSVAFNNLSEVYSQMASEAYAKALPATAASAPVAPRLAMIREMGPSVGTVPSDGTEVVAAGALAPEAPARASAAPAPVADLAAQSAAAMAARYPTTPPAAPAIATLAKAAPPAAAAAPPAASAPAPAAKPSPATDAKGVAAQVSAAVQTWANAWSRKDLDAYYAAYTPDFDGGKTRKVWLAERRARIVGKKEISVTVSELEVVVDGDRATARFRQSYASDRLNVSGSKTLRFVKSGEKWLISAENVES